MTKGFLLRLAQHLRPKVRTVGIDGDVLVVESNAGRIVVEVHVEVEPQQRTSIVYRNAKSRTEYGSIAHPKAAAAEILGDLRNQATRS